MIGGAVTPVASPDGKHQRAPSRAQQIISSILHNRSPSKAAAGPAGSPLLSDDGATGSEFTDVDLNGSKATNTPSDL